MTRSVARIVVPAAAACAAAAAAGLAATPARASCLPATSAELRARASVIFDGVALEGPTATGVQRFRVGRYQKGTGPAVVRVNTGYVRKADGSVQVSSVSLVVKKGQRWRIFAQGSAKRVLRTSACDGSRRLRG